MKKLFLFSLLIVLTISMAFGLSACNKNKDKPLDLTANVSYAESAKYTGADNNFRVSLTSGIKEKLFIADGVATDVASFTTISLTPLKNDLLDKTYTYTVIYDGGEVSGTLSRDVVTHNFCSAVDLGENVDKVTAVKIAYDDVVAEIAMTNVLANKIPWQKALEIATAEFKDTIAANTNDGVFPREICVKLIRDKRNPDSPYYWYVSFIAADNNYWAILIDPISGEVLTKKG